LFKRHAQRPLKKYRYPQMSNRFVKNNYKVEIDWKKIKHIRPKIEDKNISLEIKPTDSPLPRVMVITIVTDPILFSFCVRSWKNVSYPKELLNWIILDPKSLLTDDSFGDPLSGDPRIRIVNAKISKYDDTIKSVMDMNWIGVHTDRDLHYTTMECGDVWFPDTLSLKFRALEEGYDCVIPDTLAYYSPLYNTSQAFKLFLRFPKGGMYWKKRWWAKKQSDKIIGIPYLGNCITIGKPNIDAMPQNASIRFFDNFPSDVKSMVTKIIMYLQARRDELSEDDE
jgi:hypothetical protein